MKQFIKKSSVYHEREMQLFVLLKVLTFCYWSVVIFHNIPPEQRRTNLILYRHSAIGHFHLQQITNSNFHFLILF
jgi:hypothetical protein